jgi:hypothetical protein
VKTKEGTTVTVPAWPVNGGELVVTPLLEGDDQWRERGAWMITHARSGMNLSGVAVASRARALSAARDIATMAPWDLLNDDGSNVIDVISSDQRGRILDRWWEESPFEPTRRARPRAHASSRPTMADMREAVESFLPPGWALYDSDDPFGDLECPCGYRIEPDGTCPDGCTSPMPI